MSDNPIKNEALSTVNYVKGTSEVFENPCRVCGSDLVLTGVVKNLKGDKVGLQYWCVNDDCNVGIQDIRTKK